ncbi:MAG: hypothetical protein PVI91_05080 [Gammaproteobacteria bacterium]|jgi:hypothetical protein
MSKKDFPWIPRQKARLLSWLVFMTGRNRWSAWPFRLFSTSALKRYRESLSGRFPSGVEKGVLFLSCDEDYYRSFGIHLVRSALKNSKGFNIHLHLNRLSDAYRQQLERFAESETGGLLTYTWDDLDLDSLSAPRRWYFLAAVRFVRLHQLVEACHAPVLGLDADGVVVKSLEDKFDQVSGRDVGVYLRLSNTLDWRKVLASALFIMPTPLGRRYIRDVAVVVAWLLSRELHYHVDQLVIYQVWRLYSEGEPGFRVAELSQELADWECRDDSYIWSAKGDRKYFKREFLNALDD